MTEHWYVIDDELDVELDIKISGEEQDRMDDVVSITDSIDYEVISKEDYYEQLELLKRSVPVFLLDMFRKQLFESKNIIPENEWEDFYFHELKKKIKNHLDEHNLKYKDKITRHHNLCQLYKVPNFIGEGYCFKCRKNMFDIWNDDSIITACLWCHYSYCD